MSSIDLSHLEQKIQDCAAALRADDYSVFQPDARNQWLELRVSSVNDDTDVRIGEGAAGVCFAAGEVLVLDDVQDSKCLASNGIKSLMNKETVRQKGWRSMIFYPIAASDLKFGVLALYSKNIAHFHRNSDSVLTRVLDTLVISSLYQLYSRSNAEIETVLTANEQLEAEVNKYHSFLPDLETARYAVGGSLHDSLNDLDAVINKLNNIVTDNTKDLADARKRVKDSIERLANLREQNTGLRGDVVFKANVNINALIASQIDLFTRDDSNIHIRMKSSGTIRADVNPARLRQVVHNCFTNSLYFLQQVEDNSRDLQIVVEVKEVDETVEVTIFDNGVGCRPDYLEDVTKAFKSFRGGASGMGLGLAMAKRHIELHNGQLGVDSEWGHWFQVIFSFPKRQKK